uniref:Uncharacterized protein n=1 Tax=Trichogramma kaykai TaxID=54128 RepID=A0ABD2XGM7_9HYME
MRYKKRITSRHYGKVYFKLWALKITMKTYVSFEWMFALSTRISRASIFFSTSSSHFNYTLVRSSLRSRDKAVNAYNTRRANARAQHSAHVMRARGKGETIVYNASRESSAQRRSAMSTRLELEKGSSRLQCFQLSFNPHEF